VSCENGGGYLSIPTITAWIGGIIGFYPAGNNGLYLIPRLTAIGC
jgi:hypothetical protein